MHRFIAIAAATLAAFASAAGAGDVRQPGVGGAALATAAPGCIASADDTVALPAAGASIVSASGDAGYGKRCAGGRDPRWVTEVVGVHGAGFRARAAASDGSETPVTIDVYGW